MNGICESLERGRCEDGRLNAQQQSYGDSMPKGDVHSHGNLQANVHGNVLFLGWLPVLNWLPLLYRHLSDLFLFRRHVRDEDFDHFVHIHCLCVHRIEGTDAGGKASTFSQQSPFPYPVFMS